MAKIFLFRFYRVYQLFSIATHFTKLFKETYPISTCFILQSYGKYPSYEGYGGYKQSYDRDYGYGGGYMKYGGPKYGGYSHERYGYDNYKPHGGGYKNDNYGYEPKYGKYDKYEPKYNEYEPKYKEYEPKYKEYETEGKYDEYSKPEVKYD